VDSAVAGTVDPVRSGRRFSLSYSPCGAGGMQAFGGGREYEHGAIDRATAAG
jgi:hypothetical protein